MRGHVDAQSMELDAFGLQSHALLEAAFGGKQDFAVSADDAMPGNSGG